MKWDVAPAPPPPRMNPIDDLRGSVSFPGDLLKELLPTLYQLLLLLPADAFQQHLQNSAPSSCPVRFIPFG